MLFFNLHHFLYSNVSSIHVRFSCVSVQIESGAAHGYEQYESDSCFENPNLDGNVHCCRKFPVWMSCLQNNYEL